MARVLVVIPTLGTRPELLEQALDSIVAQGDIARAVLVSPPGAVEAIDAAKRRGIEWVEDPATGISAAVNAGVRARRDEEFYAWLGDDDLFRDGGLHALAHILDTNSEAVLAFGACEYILDDGSVIATNRAGDLASWLLPWGPDLIPHPGTMVRLDALEAAGFFDETLVFTLDLDLFLKLRKKGPFLCTSKVVSAFRWHPKSLTVSDRKGSSREAIMVKARHLPRFLRPFHPLWSYPIAVASSLAAWLLNVRASRASH